MATNQIPRIINKTANSLTPDNTSLKNIIAKIAVIIAQEEPIGETIEIDPAMNPLKYESVAINSQRAERKSKKKKIKLSGIYSLVLNKYKETKIVPQILIQK